jgi:hypothetical protein
VRAYKTSTRLSNTSLNRFANRLKTNDLWVNWGSFKDPHNLVLFPIRLKILNPYIVGSKKEELLTLASKGIPVPEMYDYPAPGSIGRSLHHQGGRDLLTGGGRDFYTQKLPLIREMRIHVFKGKSIHAGIKVPRIPNPHEWIRSYESGWKIDYSLAVRIRQDRRELAKSAVAALGLDFGAVDLGIVPGNNAYVLEVNTAPGLDQGPSVEVYTDQIMRELQ